MKKVCVLIVTFNRKEYLKKLLENLLKQKISGILVVDNFSNDGTDEMLQSDGFIDELETSKLLEKNINKKIKFYYYKNNVNSGGAGGFNKAFSIVQELDYDYVWVMDDDVLPSDDCLPNLLKYMQDDVAICVPNRTDDNYKDIAIVDFNLKSPFLINQKRKKVVRDFAGKDVIEIADMPFEGPLMKMDIIKKVGLPNKDMFIFYDDTDYAHRSLKYGKILFVVDAILHKQIIPKLENSYSFNWRSYYLYRNSMYFESTYGENSFVRKCGPILTCLMASIKSILRLQFNNLKVIKRAYSDFKNNKYGKTVNPGEF